MSKKVLVVDDDQTIRDMVQAILEAEGFSVTTAEDGAKGVAIIDQCEDPSEYTLLVIDVVMPEMNGLDVVTRLKLHPRTSSLPILMLTGEDKAENIMAGYTVGADYYITKPFTRDQLLYGLKVVLEGWES